LNIDKFIHGLFVIESMKTCMIYPNSSPSNPT